MPIYIWKCEKCETVVEELRKMGEDEPPVRVCDLYEGSRPSVIPPPCEFKKQLTSANFRIDPAAG